jgi:hypothetical protein
MESTTQSHLFDLQVDQTATVYLRDAARWAKFLAVAGFIFCGLFLAVAILIMTLLSSLFNSMGAPGPGINSMGSGPLGIIYICIAVLNFFPCLYLYNFAARMQLALRNNDQDQLTRSFKNMRSFYRFVGMLMIVWLGISALGFLILLISTATRSSG